MCNLTFKKPLFCLVLVLCITFDVQGAWISIDQGTKEDIVKPFLASSDTSQMDLTLQISGYTITQFEDQGQLYDVLEIPGCGKDAPELGLPELPVKSFFVEIPYGVQVSTEVLYADEISLGTGYMVYPKQPDEPDSYDAMFDRSFRIDNQIYSADNFYPTQTVEIDDPGFIRGRRIVQVKVYPVKFNPVTTELVMIKSIGIRLSYSGTARDASARKARLKSENFENLARNLLVNYTPIEATMDTEEGAEGLSTTNSADYLIIVDDALYDEILPLAEWKHKKGYKTRVVLMSTVGTTAANIQTYIQNAYNNWSPAPSYVLLAGDHDVIPADYYPGTYPCYTDYYYSCVDGGDEFPDLNLGRLPFSDVADMTNAVTKILTYEKTPVTGTFYDDILCAGYFQDDGDDGNAVNDDCIADRWFMETTASVYEWLVRNNTWEGYTALCTTHWPRTCTTANYHFRSKTYTHRADINDEIWGCAPDVYPDPVPSWIPSLWTSAADASQDISDAINTGVGLVLHRDHAGSTGWSDPPFYAANITALNNENRLPVVLSANCLSGSFHYNSATFCDNFLRKETGGCVGILGATRISYSGINDLIIHGMFDCMFPDYDSTYGDVTYPSSFRPTDFINYGKYYMRSFYPVSDSGESGLYMFHWFGDPEMQLRTASPTSMTVTHTEYRWKDTTGSVYVTVTYGGVGVEGALVCITHPDTQEHWTGITNASGTVTISGVTFTASGLYDIVVSSRNHRPYEGTIISRERYYYTELFSDDDNDLSYTTIQFTPDGSKSCYKTCEDYAGVFPVGIEDAVALPLIGDDYEQVTLTGGKEVMLYGEKYSSFYVSTKGYITFDSGESYYTETLERHFAQPRISALFDDLAPGTDGAIYFQQLADRAVVTYSNVTEWYASPANSNSFQIQMLFDGTIIITWLEREALGGLAGLSAGGGIPVDYVEHNLSSNAFCCTPRPTRPINPEPEVGANSITTKTTLHWSEKSVVINEIDMGAVDALELYNTTPEAIDLTDWQVVCIRTTGTTVLMIPEFSLDPYAYVVLSEAAGTNTATELYFDQNILWLGTYSGSCSLIDADGMGIDFVRWSSNDGTSVSTEQPPAGTSWSGIDPWAPLDDTVDSLARDMRGNDRDLTDDWENTSGINAVSKTPGSWNYSVASAAMEMMTSGDEDADSSDIDGLESVDITSDISRPANVLAAIASLNDRAGGSSVSGNPADGIETEEADGIGDAASVMFITGGDPAVYQPDIAIVAAAAGSITDPRFTDPQAKLLATGKFNSVSLIDARVVTPTPAELKAFDAVIVWSNYGFNDAVLLGDNLADYIDDGGGVVLAVFADTHTGSLMLQGRFSAEQYYCIEPGNSTTSTASGLGTNDSLHPLMEGVISLSGSTCFRPLSTNLLGGSTVVAEWTDGKPLIVERQVNGRPRVDLGIYPPSSDVSSSYWDAATDGDLIMANALMYVARAVAPKTQDCYVLGGNPNGYSSPQNSFRANVVTFNTYQLLSEIGMDLSYEGDQYRLTDEFDFGEDTSSHSYTESGSVYTGAYDCDGDGTLRIGSGDIGSWAQIVVKVTPGVNRVKLRYQIPWHNTNGSVLYVDGSNKGTLTGSGCDWQETVLTYITSSTADGYLTIRLVDESDGNAGDMQITRLEVYSGEAVVDLHYYVLESTSLEGTYTPIYEKVVPTCISSRAYHTSGPIAVALNSYRYYAIGVAWGDDHRLRYHFRTRTLPADWELGTVQRYAWINSPSLPLSATTLGLSTTYEYNIGLCFSADYVPETIYAAAASPGYMFGTIDSDTAVFTSVGSAIGQVVDAMTYDENHDILYASLFTDAKLVSIHQSTGAVTELGLSGATHLRGLAYDSNHDILYGIEQTYRHLYTINTYTGEATSVGTYSGGYIGGLAYDPESDTLYGVLDGYAASPETQLVKINTSTGALTSIGELGEGIVDVDSLAYSRLTHRLYAINDDTAELLAISPVTGKATVVGGTGVTWPDGGHGLAIKPDYNYMTRYDVYLDTVNPPLNQVAKDIFVTELATGELDEFETYYWQVVGKTRCSSKIGDVWSFNTCPAGDYDDDCDVDLMDFSVFAAAWMTEESDADYNPACDIAIPLDEQVDLDDFIKMAENWCDGK